MAIMHSRDGVTVVDMQSHDQPLIFVNRAFEAMTGYKEWEVLGKNCRFLQGDLSEQAELQELRIAIGNARPCLVTLRNFRKDGTVFWNELSLSPIFDTSGKLTHFIGIQKDVTARVRLEERLKEQNKALEAAREQLTELAIRDSLTALYNRRFFDKQLITFWNIALRQQNPLVLFFVDIDYFKEYNDLYGHLRGDAVLQQVAEFLSRYFQRQSEFVARYGGDELVVLCAGELKEKVKDSVARAKELCRRLAELQIPHEHSPSKSLTISVGVTEHVPQKEEAPSVLIEKSDRALYFVKQQGRNGAAGLFDELPVKIS